MKEKDKVREVNITFGKALGCIIGGKEGLP